MRVFKISVVIWALLPLLTGLMDIIVGPSAWKNIGVDLGPTEFSDSVLDSQIRFVGTVWFGYGVLLLICLKNLEKYASILQGAFLIVFLGGLARLLSILFVGMPESSTGTGFIIFALVIELVLMPFLMIWLRKLMR